MGGPGVDVLDGGPGLDRIFVGAGDTTTGGPGPDIFWVDLSGFPTSLPVITDFQPGVDVLNLFTDAAAFQQVESGFRDAITQALFGVAFDIAEEGLTPSYNAGSVAATEWLAL